MSFSFKEKIYKIIDNNIDELKLKNLNKQELNKVINALKFNHSLKILSLYDCNIENITPLCKSLKNNYCLKSIYL